MRTQDNRMTADPYFFTAVVTKHQYVEAGEGKEDVFVVFDGDCHQYDTLEDALADDWDEHEIERRGIVDKVSHHNVFLTASASKHYLERNGSKLGSDEPVYDFVDYADRNPQLTRLFRILKSIK